MNAYQTGFDDGERLGAGIAVRRGRVELASHIMDHPEISAVLDSQCGAQSDGCCYDTADRSEEAAPEWLKEIIAENRRLWAAGRPGYISAVLASDGWWWKIV